jgi:uncharacterized protein (DUF3084 family)
MKKISILSMVISFAMICSCQKQDSAAEQQLAQRKVELDAREEALIEREKVVDERKNALDERENALAKNERATANAQMIPPDVQTSDMAPDAEQAKVERDRRIQQLAAEFRAMIPDSSTMKAEKDRMTQDRLAQRQRTPDNYRAKSSVSRRCLVEQYSLHRRLVRQLHLLRRSSRFQSRTFVSFAPFCKRIQVTVG